MIDFVRGHFLYAIVLYLCTKVLLVLLVLLVLVLLVLLTLVQYVLVLCLGTGRFVLLPPDAPRELSI